MITRTALPEGRDVCLRKKELSSISSAEYEKYSNRVIDVLQEGPLGIIEITNRLLADEELLILVLDKMIEEGMIKRGDDLKFSPQ